MPHLATGDLFPLNAPYYIVPDVEAYRKLDPDSEEALRLRRLITVNIGDPETLRRIFGDIDSQTAPAPDRQESKGESAFNTIDSFLERYGFGKAGATYETAGQSNTGELHNMLINRRFEEALKLIELQNLNNREKSIYFAHQIRFLKKLIAIEKHKSKTKG